MASLAIQEGHQTPATNVFIIIIAIIIVELKNNLIIIEQNNQGYLHSRQLLHRQTEIRHLRRARHRQCPNRTLFLSIPPHYTRCSIASVAPTKPLLPSLV